MGDPVKVTIGENNEGATNEESNILAAVSFSNIYNDGATNGGSKNTEKVAYGYPVLATNGNSKNNTKVGPANVGPANDAASTNVRNWA